MRSRPAYLANKVAWALPRALVLAALVLVLLALRGGPQPAASPFPALGPAPASGVRLNFSPQSPGDKTFGSNGLGGGSYAP